MFSHSIWLQVGTKMSKKWRNMYQEIFLQFSVTRNQSKWVMSCAISTAVSLNRHLIMGAAFRDCVKNFEILSVRDMGKKPA